MNVSVFLGPAGSGKGTQAQYLKDNYNFYHISTGDLLRDEIKSNTNLGQKVQSIIDSGDLVPDSLIINLLNKLLTSLLKNSEIKGVIFDGFPRTVEQGENLNLLLTEFNLNLKHVFYFKLTLEESIRRISGRRIDSRNNTIYHLDFNSPPKNAIPFLVRRDDDDPIKVKHRYKVYKEQTEPLLKFYANSLVEINCQQSIDEINSFLNETLKSQLSSLH